MHSLNISMLSGHIMISNYVRIIQYQNEILQMLTMGYNNGQALIIL